jgi:hypothetical protein
MQVVTGVILPQTAANRNQNNIFQQPGRGFGGPGGFGGGGFGGGGGGNRGGGR